MTFQAPWTSSGRRPARKHGLEPLPDARVGVHRGIARHRWPRRGRGLHDRIASRRASAPPRQARGRGRAARGRRESRSRAGAGRAARPPMTAHRRTLETRAAQERVIATLCAASDRHAADRLARCMQARIGRRQGDGWPWTCRSAGCAWCGSALARRWWRGLVRWATVDGASVSLAILPLSRRPGDLHAAVVRLRRACRDVRDRAARRDRRWCDVAVAGVADGDGTVPLLIRHAGINRAEIAEACASGGRTRWSGLSVRRPRRGPLPPRTPPNSRALAGASSPCESSFLPSARRRWKHAMAQPRTNGPWDWSPCRSRCKTV